MLARKILRNNRQ